MDDIATYDYADHNQIRVEGSQATNPPPVSGEATLREEEFYNAEDHMYAAVNKKARRRRQKIVRERGKILNALQTNKHADSVFKYLF